MKKTLIYTGNVGRSTVRRLPADYIGEKVPYNATTHIIPAVPAFDRLSVHAAAVRNAAALARYRGAAAVPVLASKAAHSVCRALVAKSGLTKNPVRRPTWPGELSAAAANISNVGHDETWTVQQMRWDIISHNGTGKTAGYWERVDAFAAAMAENEYKETSLASTAAAASKAAAAAKRAGNMSDYTDMTAAAKDYTAAAQVAHKAAKTAERGLWVLVNDYAVGKGVDLYQTAALYLWERLAVDGLTVNSLTREKAANGRVSVKTVFQWACIRCRRAIRDEARINDQTAAGYTYFTVAAALDDSEETRRAPRLYDVDGMGGGDGRTTAETLDELNRLIDCLELSPSQREIMSYRLEGFSRNDIVEKMGITRNALNKQMSRIVEKASKCKEFDPEKLAKAAAKFNA